MNLKLADQVRAMALMKYVMPAKKAGKKELSVAVRSLLKDLEEVDFPLNYTPLVCSAIKTQGFQRENGLEITSIDGPKSQTGTTVVIHYRIVEKDLGFSVRDEARNSAAETPEQRANRLVKKLRGLLRQEITNYGGTEAFMRWMRSEDEDAA
jgi:hypothetical protein